MDGILESATWLLSVAMEMSKVARNLGSSKQGKTFRALVASKWVDNMYLGNMDVRHLNWSATWSFP